MERNPEKGRLSHSPQIPRRNSCQKAIVAITLLFLTLSPALARLWTVDTPDREVALSFYQRVADQYEVGVSYADSFIFDNRQLPFRLGLTYSSLGEFIFLDSEGYAYSNPRSVFGNGFGVDATMGYRFEALLLSFSLQAHYRRVWEYDSFILQFELMAQYESLWGVAITKAGITNDTFHFHLAYQAPLYIQPIRITPLIGYTYLANHILMAGLKIETYGKDFSLSVLAKIGIVYPLYDMLSFELEKEFDFLTGVIFSFSWTPSLLGNNLYGVSARFQLDQF